MLAGLDISTDRARIDVALVHEFLNTTYWAEGRPRDVVERSIANVPEMRGRGISKALMQAISLDSMPSRTPIN
jgi:hypothetical protein